MFEELLTIRSAACPQLQKIRVQCLGNLQGKHIRLSLSLPWTESPDSAELCKIPTPPTLTASSNTIPSGLPCRAPDDFLSSIVVGRVSGRRNSITLGCLQDTLAMRLSYVCSHVRSMPSRSVPQSCLSAACRLSGPTGARPEARTDFVFFECCQRKRMSVVAGTETAAVVDSSLWKRRYHDVNCSPEENTDCGCGWRISLPRERPSHAKHQPAIAICRRGIAKYPPRLCPPQLFPHISVYMASPS